MKLNCLFYIHHNYDFTVSLPLATPAMGQINNLTTRNYGFLNSTTLNGDQNFTPLPTFRTKLKSDLLNGGRRYYLGIFTSGSDPHNPEKKDNYYDTSLTPNYSTFELLQTELDFEVSTGYDSPENIGNKISTDFKGATTSPQYPQSTVEEPEAFAYQSIAFNTTPYAIKNLSVTEKNAAVNTIDGMPRSFLNGAQGTKSQVSIYQNYIGVANPFYYYHGSRLQSNRTTVKANLYLKKLYDDGLFRNPPQTSHLMSINSLPFNNIYSQYDDGYVVGVNLPFTEDTLKYLVPFIHAQKKYFGIEGTTESLRTTDKDLFKWNVLWGRLQAEQGENNGTGIESPLAQANERAETFENHFSPAFYNDSMFNSQYINDTDIKLVPNHIITYKGIDYTVKNLAKKLDITVTAIDTGMVDDDGKPEIVIGFPLFGERHESGSKYFRGNYLLVDFSFARDVANAVLVLNPFVKKGGNTTNKDDYTRSLSIGAPDMNLAFDGTRGRFAFDSMSWANYVGSADSDTAVPTADQEVITSNAQNKIDPERFALLDNGVTKRNAFTKYAQTGIGIKDISVVLKNGSTTVIQRDDENDIKKKYTNSLLDRLGFDYHQIVDTFGLADVIFSNRTYQIKTPRPLPNFFPYPFTTNARFDTTLNQSLSANDNDLPGYDLQNTRNIINVNISAETDKAYANRPPNKLAYPYWIIQSDIIDGISYTSNEGQPNNIIGVCGRSYTSGNFAFSMNEGYSVIATHEFVVTGIKTRILNPDYSAAEVDLQTSIIYRITSPIQQLQMNEKAQQMEQEEREKQTKSQ